MQSKPPEQGNCAVVSPRKPQIVAEYLVILNQLIRLQAQFDFQKAHHARQGALRKQVRVIA